MIRFDLDPLPMVLTMEELQWRLKPTIMRGPFQEVIGEHFQQRTRRRFDLRGRTPEVPDWPALAQSTILEKMQGNYPEPTRPNVRTRDLMLWLQTATPTVTLAGGGMTMKYPGRRTALRDKKLRLTQFGRKDGRVPARPTLGVDSVDTVAVSKFVKEWVETGIVPR